MASRGFVRVHSPVPRMVKGHGGSTAGFLRVHIAEFKEVCSLLNLVENLLPLGM